MAQNYSDSDEEFTGFNSEDITIDNDYIPDSETDSDITVSAVQSGDISSLGRRVVKVALMRLGKLSGAKIWGDYF